jgi:hypothetical protein
MQGLEDLEVVDGEAVAASLIPRAVTAGELLYDDGATQTFDVNGDTTYVEADGRPTQGQWYVDEDGRFCSFWPPTYRACYGLLWIVEGVEIVGLSFTELGRGTRFDGRDKTPAHRPQPKRQRGSSLFDGDLEAVRASAASFRRRPRRRPAPRPFSSQL